MLSTTAQLREMKSGSLVFSTRPTAVCQSCESTSPSSAFSTSTSTLNPGLGARFPWRIRAGPRRASSDTYFRAKVHALYLCRRNMPRPRPLKHILGVNAAAKSFHLPKFGGQEPSSSPRQKVGAGCVTHSLAISVPFNERRTAQGLAVTLLKCTNTDLLCQSTVVLTSDGLAEVTSVADLTSRRKPCLLLSVSTCMAKKMLLNGEEHLETNSTC